MCMHAHGSQSQYPGLCASGRLMRHSCRWWTKSLWSSRESGRLRHFCSKVGWHSCAPDKSLSVFPIGDTSIPVTLGQGWEVSVFPIGDTSIPVTLGQGWQVSVCFPDRRHIYPNHSRPGLTSLCFPDRRCSYPRHSRSGPTSLSVFPIGDTTIPVTPGQGRQVSVCFPPKCKCCAELLKRLQLFRDFYQWARSFLLFYYSL